MTSDQVRLVTVSASYGAGGSVVAPALAERLGVPFLQRATTSAGGVGAGPCAERLTPDEANLTPATGCSPASPRRCRPGRPSHRRRPPSGRAPAPPLRAGHPPPGRRRRGRDPRPGRGGRARQGPRVPRAARRAAAARVVQGAAIEGISVDEARRHLDAADRARDAYVRRLYRADPADPRHYHLVIDSTAIPLDAVTEIILRALAAPPVSSRPGVLRRGRPVEIPALARRRPGSARGGFRSSPAAGCARRRARRRRSWRRRRGSGARRS